jgi:hypothetical protein
MAITRQLLENNEGENNGEEETVVVFPLIAGNERTTGLVVGLGRRVCWGRLRWGSRARRRCLRAAGRRTCCAGVRARLGSAARERAVRGERD